MLGGGVAGLSPERPGQQEVSMAARKKASKSKAKKKAPAKKGSKKKK
jgi:hypothetical protein